MGHSTVDALVRLVAVRTSFQRGESVVAIFLDISHAFDALWHGGFNGKIAGELAWRAICLVSYSNF